MTTHVKTISSNYLFIPGVNKNLKVTYENRDFYVIDAKGLKTPIQRAYLDKELRGVSEDTLQKMLDIGYLTLNKFGEDYSIKFSSRLRGGGPFGAVAVFFTTYGTGLVMTGIGTVLVCTGVGAPAGAALIATGATTMTVAAPLAAAAVVAPTP